MTDSAPLERRYRQLLACYPAEHRQTYGEEMIGVLLASSGSGRRRPSLADSANIVGGGLRVRLRRLRSADGNPARWRDALSVAAIIAPLFLLGSIASNYSSLWRYSALPRFGRYVLSKASLLRTAQHASPRRS